MSCCFSISTKLCGSTATFTQPLWVFHPARTPTPACRILNLGEILVSSISQALDNDDNNFVEQLFLNIAAQHN